MIAVKDVNNATDILPGHQLSLDINDGQFGCLTIYILVNHCSLVLICALRYRIETFVVFSIKILTWNGQVNAKPTLL